MKWALILFTFIVFFSTCDLSFLNGNRSYQYSLVDENGDPITSSIPNDDFFYVDIYGAHYVGEPEGFNPLDFAIYAMDEGPGTKCKISVNEESATEDLYCMMEVAEGDLWHHEIELEYNVPEGMCAYLGFLPHWHYNQPVGAGPATVYKCSRSVWDAERQEVVQVDGYQSPDSSCFEKKEDVCPYGSGIEGLSENCCYGKYRIEGESDTQEWDGVKNCIGGLVRAGDWEAFDKNGFPMFETSISKKDGVNKKYKINPLIDTVTIGQRFTLPTANYFSGMEDKEWEEEQEPSFYRFPNKSGYYADAPFLTWACLDHNREVLHTIRLIIREWNTQEELKRFVESEGSSGDPDTGGFEGPDCDYYENNTFALGECDDLKDADIFSLGLPACDNKCDDDKGECDDKCDDDKGECDNKCNDDKGECDDKCDDDKGECDDKCDDDKDTCDTTCTTTKTACDTGCSGNPNEVSCLADCTSDYTTCEALCTTTETTCKALCTTTKTTCDDDCDDDKQLCNIDCNYAETTCDNDCKSNKTICNNDCHYPLIIYEGA